MLHILLANDDGIRAPGIAALWEELASFAKITVVAPESERSATSQAITVHEPIRVEQYKVNHSNVSAWQISGTPTDCVKIALEAILQEKPDILISGINHGPNLGTDILYSGTVSAAIEGALHGIPSVAVSLDTWKLYDFSPAAKITKKIVHTMVQHELPPRTLLNVNIPAIPENELKEIKITKLGERMYQNTFQKRQDPRGKTYYWMGGEVVDLDNTDDTDVYAVRQGYVSVTPIHFDLTNYTIMNMLGEWKF